MYSIFFNDRLAITMQNLKKNPCCNSWDKSLYSFWSLFWEALMKLFLCTYCAASCCKAWKQSLEPILRIKTWKEIKAWVILGHNWAKTASLVKNRILSNYSYQLVIYQITIKVIFIKLLSPIILQRLIKKIHTAYPVI